MNKKNCKRRLIGKNCTNSAEKLNLCTEKLNRCTEKLNRSAEKTSGLVDETRFLKEELLALSPKECARYVSRKVKALLKE